MPSGVEASALVGVAAIGLAVGWHLAAPRARAARVIDHAPPAHATSAIGTAGTAVGIAMRE